MEKAVNPVTETDNFLDVFDYALDTFKKHVVRNCDDATANKILRSTKRDLKKIVPIRSK